MANNQLNEEDFELLGDLGFELDQEPGSLYTARQERIIAGFEQIVQFVQQHKRLPQTSESRDIFERIYAVRLERMRESEECRSLLSAFDHQGLLTASTNSDLGFEEELSDEELLAAFADNASLVDDLSQLQFVRSYQEIKAAEEVAQRSPCPDFKQFKPLFKQVQQDLQQGTRTSIKYQDNAEVKQGDLFILEGQISLVAELGELFVPDHGRPDRRLRVIYDNGTESNLLMRSLQRALNKDKHSRRIVLADLGPLFAPIEQPPAADSSEPTASEEAEELPSGFIYVLRSKSEHPFIVQNRNIVHKIGVTGGDIKKRIANAKQDPTYLLADVEIVASFKLVNINRKRLEALIQKFFGNARLVVELKDLFGNPVQPKEWFLVPLEVIEEAIEKIREGTLDQYRYDVQTARIVRI